MYRTILINNFKQDFLNNDDPEQDTGEEEFTEFENYGLVAAVGDGIVHVSGLEDVEAGALVQVIASSTSEVFFGIALNLEPQMTLVALLSSDRAIREGDIVLRYESAVKVGVSTYKFGKNLMARVMDGIGLLIDEGEEVSIDEQYEVDIKAPGIIARKSVHEPLQTGIKAIDSMIPIGRGQRELIIGDRQTGKTTVAVNTLLMQAVDNMAFEGEDMGDRVENLRVTYDSIVNLPDKTIKGHYLTTLAEDCFPVRSMYVSIGQKRSGIVNLVDLLKKYDALPNVMILAATASEPASLQYLAPYTACRLSEYYRDHGGHALIIYDDLSKHAVAYRQLSLLLRRPPGREAYPGDVFYLHSRLLERAAKLSINQGSGSLTALPIIETQKGDVSAYIPTNVISITDGQIFLETDLFYNGVRPAVNVGLSVSRVGSSAQNPILKKVASSLRFELAQYRTVAVLEELSSDLDPTTKHQIHRGVRLVEMLKQSPYQPLLIEQQIILLYAAMSGHFDKLLVEKILQMELEIIEQYDSFDLGLIALILNKETGLSFDFFSYFLDETLQDILQINIE